MAALTGGGLKAKPGEVSLAHNGVLFLDELPEFGTQALDSLRQPLETGEVVVARANAHVRYPVRFQLVAGREEPERAALEAVTDGPTDAAFTDPATRGKFQPDTATPAHFSQEPP